jgi:heptaprenyl diphosphate synthase
MTDIFKKTLSDKHIFLQGLLVLPAFLLQENLVIKTVQAGVFLLLCFLSGRRIKLLPVLVISFSIIFLNILNPIGQVIFSLGRFRITRGAFRIGAFRSATIIGLIYLSRFSVRRSLKIPGSYGALAGKMLYYFEEILSAENKFKIKTPVNSINSIIREVYDKGSGSAFYSTGVTRSSRTGILFAVLFVFINWALFFLFSFLNS